jgi:glycosyltransferase involved in cell wall biosynthesis
MRVLCLDIEGGFGGSSRSLFESLRHMGGMVSAEVWCARPGPVLARYAAIGTPARAVPGMPRFTALPRLSRNLLAGARYGREWLAAARFRAELAARCADADIVHLNHESLHGVGLWLRARVPGVRVCFHLRTMLPPGPFARWQSRRVAAAAHGIVYITENERARFLAHLGPEAHEPRWRVIHNIAVPVEGVAPSSAIPADGRLVVACLSNYAWVRGIDRVVEIARALQEMGRRDVLFVVAGDMTLPRSLPGELGATARAGGDLSVHARRMGVADMILFLGHVPDPESVLAASHVLVKPTREANPWGRDIIEALAAGRPVLSVGRYDRFVEDGVTGVLQPDFDADAMAGRIARLADNRDEIERMALAGAARVAALCGGPARAADLLGFWRELAGRNDA